MTKASSAVHDVFMCSVDTHEIDMDDPGDEAGHAGREDDSDGDEPGSAPASQNPSSNHLSNGDGEDGHEGEKCFWEAISN